MNLKELYLRIFRDREMVEYEDVKKPEQFRDEMFADYNHDLFKVL